MGTFLIVYGAVGLVGLVWLFVVAFPLQPANVGGGLLLTMVPLAFIVGGIFLRRREQTIRQRRAAYLNEHDVARSTYQRARLIQWLSFPTALVMYGPVVAFWPAASNNPLVIWPLLAAAFGGTLYGTFAQHKLDNAANRAALGEPPLSSSAQRKKAWMIAFNLAVAGAIFVIDQLFPQLELVGWMLVAIILFLPVAGLVAGGAYIWRRTKKAARPDA